MNPHLTDLDYRANANRLKVYTAGSLRDVGFWKELLVEWPEINFTARWVTHHAGVTPDEEFYAKVFWMHDQQDVLDSDVVMIWTLEEEPLRGALVEVGMALAYGKQVIAVGEHPSFGTWQYHPQVHRCAKLSQARALLKAMAAGL